MTTRTLRSICSALFLLVCLLTAQAERPAAPVPVLMLSDIHFDPFHDPGKLVQLRTAPISAWHAILAGPDTTTQAADFTKLQTTCDAKGIDTPFALLASALNAAHTQQAQPVFVTVSGDLMAHKFDCRYRTLIAGATDAEYSAFAAKTVAFVARELRETFPGVPIYLALGNNDSGCKDYDEDPGSAFLREDALAFATDAISLDNASGLLHDFPAFGDANLVLPEPFHHTHLLLMQDVFQSKRYAGCNGKPNDLAAKQQIDWLRVQLTAAKRAHEQVWVMAHIPPGIDAYSTFSKARDLCSATAAAAPETFLGSEDLAKTMLEFPDVIRLALFGHTHMDEMRLYVDSVGKAIPGKLVPSISPVNGNSPAFTLAQVDPATATMLDYTVFVAENRSGTADNWSSAAVHWQQEYRFSAAYNVADFSAASVDTLTRAFVKDTAGTQPASQSYAKFYFAGDPQSAFTKAAAMHLIWPGYACSLTNVTKSAFRNCACAARP